MTRSGTIAALVAVLVLLAGGVVAVLVIRPWQVAGQECTVPGSIDPAGAGVQPTVELTAAQLQHASTINAVGLARGLPERARIIALATAYQESSLRNRPDGDRDSVGLFQQRPSQGWGTAEQVIDPVYSSGMFYDALLEVPDWSELPLTVAAQAVQYSAFPDAYAQWEPQATTLVRGLSGGAEMRVSCREDALPPTADAPARDPVPGAEAAAVPLAELLAAAGAELGEVTVLDVADGGTAATVRVGVPGLDDAAAGRALAAWSVAHAAGFGVTGIDVQDGRWSDHEWAVRRRPVRPGAGGRAHRRRRLSPDRCCGCPRVRSRCDARPDPAGTRSWETVAAATHHPVTPRPGAERSGHSGRSGRETFTGPKHVGYLAGSPASLASRRPSRSRLGRHSVHTVSTPCRRSVDRAFSRGAA